MRRDEGDDRMGKHDLMDHVTRLVEEAVEGIEYLSVVEYGEEYGLSDEEVDVLSGAVGTVRLEVHLDD